MPVMCAVRRVRRMVGDGVLESEVEEGGRRGESCEIRVRRV
jgi:hypothetical protein